MDQTPDLVRRGICMKLLLGVFHIAIFRSAGVHYPIHDDRAFLGPSRANHSWKQGQRAQKVVLD